MDRNRISRLELLVNGRVTGRYAGSSHRFPVATRQHGTVMSVRVRAYDKAGNVRVTPARKRYR